MKKITKVLGAFLAFVLSAVTLIGCGNTGTGNGGQTVNSDMTQFYVGNLDGGLGDTWLNHVIEEFCEYYKDYSFEEGKTGIQVWVSNKKDEYAGTTLLPNILYNQEDVYFLNEIDYLTYSSSGSVADISDIVTEKVYDDNGELATENPTKSIDDIIYDEWRGYYNLGTDETPLYFGLPFYNAVSGIIYDADLFDSMRFYFKADGTIGANQADIDARNCGPGPDDVMGTYDDGMPETWNDFLTLLNRLVTSGITPFTWSGQHSYMREYAIMQILANYEGYNDFQLNNTLRGTDSSLGDINPQNAYLLAQQPGKKAALQAAYDIISNSNYYDSNAMRNSSHLDAQYNYVYSVNTNNRIAMLFEGGWWENEARDTFDMMEGIDDNWGYGKRNFKLLPVPRFEGVEGIENQTNKDPVLFAVGGHSIVCVKANTPNMKAAKKFVQFVHSRSSMVTFTTYTSCLKPFEYEIKDEERATMTQFTQNILEIREMENSSIVYKKNDIIGEKSANATFFTNWPWRTGVTINGAYLQLQEPFSAFWNYPTLTVQQYFEGLETYIDRTGWPIN